MARVTVEDCTERVQNRFELVMLAAQRARKIGSGSAVKVNSENDKKTVISLREIAGGAVSVDALKEEMIVSHQRFVPQDSEEDEIDFMDGEKEWGDLAEGGSAPTGMYADEDVSSSASSSGDEDGDKEPSLGDIAGV